MTRQNFNPLGVWNVHRPFTSPFGGEVDPLGSGEGACLEPGAKARPHYPALCADLSPKGEVKSTPP